jgi:hypothetical protein
MEGSCFPVISQPGRVETGARNADVGLLISTVPQTGVTCTGNQRGGTLPQQNQPGPVTIGRSDNMSRKYSYPLQVSSCYMEAIIYTVSWFDMAQIAM